MAHFDLANFNLSAWQEFNINQFRQNQVRMPSAILQSEAKEEHSKRLPTATLLDDKSHKTREDKIEDGQRNDTIKIKITIEVDIVKNGAKIVSCELIN